MEPTTNSRCQYGISERCICVRQLNGKFSCLRSFERVGKGIIEVVKGRVRGCKRNLEAFGIRVRLSTNQLGPQLERQPSPKNTINDYFLIWMRCVITIFRNRSRDEIVFRVARSSLINLGGVEIKSSAAGPMESMVCSNKRVKSNPERHS